MRVANFLTRLAQVVQRGDRCPVPGNIRGQLGWGPEHPGLEETTAITPSGFPRGRPQPF